MKIAKKLIKTYGHHYSGPAVEAFEREASKVVQDWDNERTIFCFHDGSAIVWDEDGFTPVLSWKQKEVDYD